MADSSLFVPTALASQGCEINRHQMKPASNETGIACD
jgi:hypothetical protein